MKKLIAALIVACVGCAHGPDSEAGGAGPEAAAEASGREGKVLARVNGVPITELDVQLRLERDHEAAPGPEHRRNVLDQLVTREILAQKAAEKGLDRDARYQEGLERLLAQVEAYRRQELSERLLAREGGKRGAPSEQDARAYFERNEARFRTQVHVLQILRRSEAAIVEARSAVERGKDFEEVAKGLFPGLPEGQRPWDLGYLSLPQVPGPWRDTVYDMKPGEMSGVLRGPNERYWLVKLVGTREDPGVTFETAREAVLADMAANGQTSGREALEKELRAAAKVEITGEP